MIQHVILVGEGFSPWTEKARWALEHHGLAYRYVEYTPLVSEPWLRMRARKWRGPISVPYLLGPRPMGDSFAIACEADRIGGATPLVPGALVREITDWNARAERLMRAGRSMILARTEESAELQRESLPRTLPSSVRRVLAPTVRIGTAYLRKKYAVTLVPDEVLEGDLLAVRASIANREHLLGQLTLADVAIASALQVVRPHGEFPRGISDAQRAGWERPALAARFGDLLAWRDALVLRHRR